MKPLISDDCDFILENCCDISRLSTLSNSVTKLQSSVSSTADLMRAAISQTVTEVSVEGKMPKKSKPKPSTSKTAVNVPQEIVSSVNKAASEQVTLMK